MLVVASEGRVQMVEYLMNLASDPTAKDKFDNTPFNDAVRSKHDEVVSVIKKFDPEISFKLAGNEPLRMAIFDPIYHLQV